MVLKCTGCGSTETLAEVKTTHPKAVSCCPERKMKEQASAYRMDVLLRVYDEDGNEVDDCGVYQTFISKPTPEELKRHIDTARVGLCRALAEEETRKVYGLPPLN